MAVQDLEQILIHPEATECRQIQIPALIMDGSCPGNRRLHHSSAPVSQSNFMKPFDSVLTWFPSRWNPPRPSPPQTLQTEWIPPPLHSSTST